jgi:hypothetical protein
MTPEERCLLIADLMRYVNHVYETGEVVGPNVWFDLAFCLVPAIAQGKPCCFTPRMKLARLLRRKEDLWSQLGEFLILTDQADPYYERKRINNPSQSVLTTSGYLTRLAAAGVPCDN